MKGEYLVIDQKDELRQHLQSEKDHKLRLKLTFLHCFMTLGVGLEEVCRGFDIATSTGYEWIRKWNREGYAGLQEAPRTGCPPRLDEWDLAYLRVCLEGRAYWTTREVKALIQEEFGVEYSDDQVVKILRQRLRMHFGKPFPRDYRRPPDAEQRLEADLKAVFGRLQHEGYAAQEVALGFIDESSPQNTANTVRVWSFEGKPQAIKNTTRLRSNTIGFYPIQGHPVQSFLPNATQEAIVPFLQAVREANVAYRAVIVVWDNFSSHQSALIQREAQKMNIYLLPLPPYSPDLNPIEYLWKSVKRVLSQVFVRNLDELKAVIRNAWKNLSCRRSFAKAWIDRFLSGSDFYADLCG